MYGFIAMTLLTIGLACSDNVCLVAAGVFTLADSARYIGDSVKNLTIKIKLNK